MFKSPQPRSGLLASPLTAILLFFLLLPIGMIVIVSFWGANEFSIYPAFQFNNYRFLFGCSVTYTMFLKTFGFAAITWALTVIIGFTVASFLAFHIRTLKWQMILFQLTTIPFWTSNIIRMISWVPFLGRNGLVNQALMNAGIIHDPLEWLLFSDFAVRLAFVHLNTLFSLTIFLLFLIIVTLIQRRRARAGSDAGKGLV